MENGPQKFSPKIEKAQNAPEVCLLLSKSPEGLPAIEIKDASSETRSIIKRVLASNVMDDPDYKMRKKVGAFLQGDSDGWMLVEFWQGNTEDQQAFVDYLNILLNKLPRSKADEVLVIK